MDKPGTAPPTLTIRRALIWWLLLAAAQGFLTLAFYLTIPSEGGGLLGFSPLRLVIMAGSALVSVLALLAAFHLQRTSEPERVPAVRWLRASGEYRWKRLIFISFLGALVGIYLFFVAFEVTEPFTRAFLERFLPLSAWFSGLCIQTILLLLWLFVKPGLLHKLRGEKIVRGALLIWGIFLLYWAWITWSQVGIAGDQRGWNVPGAPLTDMHVLLAWMAGILFLGLGTWTDQSGRRVRGWALDLVICVLLWVASLVYWTSIPLPASWFVTAPIEPNQAYYPNSDALIYDTTGQSMLVGEGYKSWDQPYPRRPMYAMLLGGLRVISDQDYLLTTALQAGLLAFFPILLFAAGKLLDNRLAGLIAAVLAILREGSGITISGNLTISHSRLLMSDFPTALGVLLFTVIVLAWLRKPDQRQGLAWLAGAVLGTFMLVRPETGVLLAAAGITGCLVLLRKPKRFFLGLAGMVIGMALLLAPWVWRNYQLTGQIFLERPGNRIDFLFNRFEEDLGPNEPTPTPTSALPGKENDSPGDLAPATDPELTVLTRLTAQGTPPIPEDEGLRSVLVYMLNHFTHSQIQLGMLPATNMRLPESLVGFLGHREPARFFNQCCSTLDYVRDLPFWDVPWDGYLPGPSRFLLPLNLFFLALGISKAWFNQRWLGLLPLIISLIYTAINALARTSGGRYLLPVEWVPMIYYSIGIAQVLTWSLVHLTRLPVPDTWLDQRGKPAMTSRKLPLAVWGAPLALLLAAGILLPFSEQQVPQRYTPEKTQEMLSRAVNGSGLTADILNQILSSGGILAPGRALYPRYYPAHEGAPGKPWTDAWAGMAKPSFYAQTFNRLSFYLVGPQNMSVLLPAEVSPSDFPHAADVLVLGCPTDSALDALAVAVFDSAGYLSNIYTRTPFPQEFTCPLPAPE